MYLSLELLKFSDLIITILFNQIVRPQNPTNRYWLCAYILHYNVECGGLYYFYGLWLTLCRIGKSTLQTCSMLVNNMMQIDEERTSYIFSDAGNVVKELDDQ